MTIVMVVSNGSNHDHVLSTDNDHNDGNGVSNNGS